MATGRDKHTTLGGFVREQREAANMSQRQLAAKVGLHYSVLSRLESGEYSQLAPDTLQRIADVLSVDVSELLRFVGVTPGLPEPRVYFRRKFGINARDAEVLARLVEDYQAKQQRHGKGKEDDEATND